MPTITPKIDNSIFLLPRVIWEGAATGDTLEAWKLVDRDGLAGAVQAVGTFGGATVTLTASNDGTNFTAVKDRYGSAMSFTSNGLAEFITSAGFIRPALAAGSANDIDIIVVLRG